MRRPRLAFVAVLAFSAVATSAHAQDLTRIDALLAGGRFTEARTELAEWRAAHPRNSRDVSAADHARALLLEGRTATSAQAALDAYLALVLGYPTAAEAPHALLLLGQGLLITGEPERARGYLERRVRDYPAAAGHAEALLWLARAQLRTARTADACATLRDAVSARAADANLRALLAHEQAQACTASDAAARNAQAPGAQPAQAERIPTPQQRSATSAERSATPAERTPSERSATPSERSATPSERTPSPAERFTVQAGAFSTFARAERLADMLAERGFDDVRIVYVPTNALARVRIGYFANTADAAQLAARLRAGGFDAAIATDAHTERARD